MLHVRLDGGVVEAPSDHPLGIEDCVVGVHGHLVLGGISDETFGVGEGDVAGGGTVALVVGDYFDLAVLEDTHARVSGSEVDTDCWSSRFRHSRRFFCSLWSRCLASWYMTGNGQGSLFIVLPW